MVKKAAETTQLELPASTAWPLVLALGITLLFAGIVTHPWVAVAGALMALRGVVGLTRDVFPHERLEIVEVAAERVEPYVAAPALVPGRDRHRLRLPVEIRPYRAGIRGGLAGAVSMAVVAIIYGLLAQRSIWYPINLLAAMAMPGLTAGDFALLRQFNAGALLVATITHVFASILVGLLYTVLLPMLPRRPLLLGGIITPILWTGMLHAVMGVINPVLDRHVSWGWFLASQVAYGLTAGAVIARATSVRTLQLVPLEERMGVERSKGDER